MKFLRNDANDANDEIMKRISKEQLARNLVQHVELADDQTPEKALGILLYGWKKKRKFGPTYCQVLINRDWLYITEVLDLSEYAGYDLTK